jgi:IS605 OrfB family transposase
MQFAFEHGEIVAPAEEKREIDDLMVRYSSAKRIAFNDLLRKHSVSDVTHSLETFDSLALNWRYCEHAARDADAELKSQQELLPAYLSDVYDKAEEVSSKLTRAKSPGKKERLQRALLRLEKRKRILEKHVADGTIPKVIFGTRKLFVDRVKGTITNQEWKDARNGQLYSIGQANQKGNANIRIDWGGKRVGVNFPERIELREAKGKVYRVKNTRRWFDLRVNERFRKYMDSLLESGQAYSVRVMRRSGKYLVQVSFEITLPSSDKVPKMVCAIDSNPGGFAAAIVSRDGNLIAHRFFRDDRLVYASEEKRGSIIGETIAGIVAWAEKHNADAFAIEDLDIRGSRSFGRRTNRVVYAFVRRKFAENLMTKCWKTGCPIGTVNPAYTSKIGDAKYKQMFGLSVHEAAAFCIGRRFFGHGEWLEKPIAITVKDGKSRRKTAARYVWASVYGYQHSADQRMEPPGRKGSAGEKRGGGNEAVFTGRPASELTPLSESDEGVRKGGGCGGSPQVTGNGVKPASSQGDGKVTAASLCDAQ